MVGPVVAGTVAPVVVGPFVDIAGLADKAVVTESILGVGPLGLLHFLLTL